MGLQVSSLSILFPICEVENLEGNMFFWTKYLLHANHLGFLPRVENHTCARLHSFGMKRKGEVKKQERKEEAKRDERKGVVKRDERDQGSVSL